MSKRPSGHQRAMTLNTVIDESFIRLAGKLEFPRFSAVVIAQD